MNTRSGIFTRGFATREKYCFCCSFGEIKVDLTLKKSNILYFLGGGVVAGAKAMGGGGGAKAMILFTKNQNLFLWGRGREGGRGGG